MAASGLMFVWRFRNLMQPILIEDQHLVQDLAYHRYPLLVAQTLELEGSFKIAHHFANEETEAHRLSAT